MAEQTTRDKKSRQRLIARSVWLTLPAPLVVTGLYYRLHAPLVGLDDPGARLAFAARWLVVAMLPYVAVCLTIAGLRFFEGSHDPTKGEESQRMKILCRVMQNTLEQLVWFAITLLALVTFFDSAQARVVPVLCALFAFARAVYWWGYTREGTLGRAPGVQLTFSLNVHMVGLVGFLAARSWM